MAADPSIVRQPTIATLQRALAREIDQLPRLSCVLERFLARAQDETATIAAITADLATDSRMHQWLLRHANSGYYAICRPLVDVGEACVVLGLQTVSDLAYAACSRHLLQHDPGPYPGTARGAWLHGLAVSSAAGRLAERLGDRSPLTAAEARVAGLLHDVGKQLVIARWPARDHGPVRDVAHELAVVGFDHATASAAMLATWRLPANLIEAVAWHHLDQAPAAAELLAAADELMGHWRVGTATYPQLDLEPPLGPLTARLAPLGADPALVADWTAELPPIIAGFDEMLRWSQRPDPLAGRPERPAATESPVQVASRESVRRRRRPADRRPARSRRR